MAKKKIEEPIEEPFVVGDVAKVPIKDTVYFRKKKFAPYNEIARTVGTDGSG